MKPMLTFRLSRYVLLAVIPLLWGGLMWSLLARQTVGGAPVSFLADSFRAFTPYMDTQWHLVRRQDTPIGYTRTILREREDKSQPYELSEEAVLTTTVGDAEVPVYLSLDSTLAADFSLGSITGLLRIGALEFTVSGKRDGDRFDVVLGAAGQTVERTIDVPAGGVSGFSLYPYLASAPLEPGARFAVPRFDPLTQQAGRIEILYLGDETYDAPDGPVSARRFLLGLGGSESEVWVDGRGRLLREEASGYVSTLTTGGFIAPFYRRFNAEAGAYASDDNQE
jgi:hypothetical protein